MNKYEQAIFKLRSYVYKEGYPEVNKINEERLSLLMELCQKENPIKPVNVNYDHELNELSWECPNCHTCYPFEKDKQDRCDVCGQLLDWSKDE